MGCGGVKGLKKRGMVVSTPSAPSTHARTHAPEPHVRRPVPVGGGHNGALRVAQVRELHDPHLHLQGGLRARGARDGEEERRLRRVDGVRILRALLREPRVAEHLLDRHALVGGHLHRCVVMGRLG